MFIFTLNDLLELIVLIIFLLVVIYINRIK